MADYGRPVEFGYSTEPGRYDEVLDSVLCWLSGWDSTSWASRTTPIGGGSWTPGRC
jgi:hypothetical protein